jgi:hypothetical protein
MKKVAQKSVLVKQVEKLFPMQDSPAISAYEQYLPYPTEPRYVQTFTTYSVCEDPIPNPYRRQ